MRLHKANMGRVRLQRGLHLVKRGQIWYVERCVGGIQSRRSLETGDLQEATRKALAEPEAPPIPRPSPPRNAKKPQPLTLATALEEYRDWYTRNRRESGARRLFPVLKMFIRAIGEDRDTRSIKREDVQRWVNQRAQALSPTTVQGDFGRVRALIRWISTYKDAADLSAVRGIERPRDPEVTKEAPSPEKIKAVLRKLGDDWIADYCRLLAETGMRPTEALGLRGVDLRGKLLSIVPWEGRLLKSKWSKRTIELNDAAAEILHRRAGAMFDKTKPIFADELGRVRSEQSVYHRLLRLLGGVKGRTRSVPEALRITLYDFRHFFCSEHAAPGPQHMEIEALAAYIGHSPHSTTTLLRWYADARALRRGAPVSVIGEPKEGKVVPISGRG